MAGLIRQLLHQDARADKTALRLFDQAQRRAQRRYPIQDNEKRHSFVDAEVIAAELEWLLRGELYPVNLLDAAQYQAVLAAIEMWNPAYPFHESAIRQRCGFIQNGLLGLLPQLKRQQQLKQLCQEYRQHLVLTAAQHLKSQKKPIASIQATLPSRRYLHPVKHKCRLIIPRLQPGIQRLIYLKLSKNCKPSKPCNRLCRLVKMSAPSVTLSNRSLKRNGGLLRRIGIASR